jgi:hypothetical protein
MCDIKFWKGNENLRSVYKKPFFEILSGFFHFWHFSALKKVHCPFQEMKTFFLWICRMGHKKSVFRTDFKYVHMTLVKSAPKKSFSQKTILPIENLPKSLKIRFFGKNLFWVHFLLRSSVHFWNQYEKTNFLIPHST